MSVQKISVGNVEITSLSDGHLDFDPCVFFPTVEKNLWEPYPDATNEHHQLSLNLGSFLIRSDGRTLLVDTGLGPVPPDAPRQRLGRAPQRFGRQGVAPGGHRHGGDDPPAPRPCGLESLGRGWRCGPHLPQGALLGRGQGLGVL